MTMLDQSEEVASWTKAYELLFKENGKLRAERDALLDKVRDYGGRMTDEQSSTLAELDEAIAANDLPSVGTEAARLMADYLDFDDYGEAADMLCTLVSERDELASRVRELEGEPSDSAVKLAQLILSDCGHSTAIRTTLLDRVALRITKHTDALLAAAPTEAKPAQPDCAGGIACTTCPDKRKCQRGCIRQGEALENPDRKDLRAECDAVDALLRGLGLDPERCRTEGGALNVGRTLSLLADGVKAKPVAWGMRWQGHGPIMDCITPEEHESHEGEYTVPLFATPPTEAKPAQPIQECYGDCPTDPKMCPNPCRFGGGPAQQDAVDAERYRLLRRGQHWSVIDGIGNVLRGDDLDAAINAKKVGAA